MELDSLNQFGPQKFREIIMAGITPETLLDDPSTLPIKGKRGQTFRRQLADLGSDARHKYMQLASLALERSEKNDASILLAGDPDYPPNLWASNNPVPILYARGAVGLLANTAAVACVGSRAIRPPYEDRQREFAVFAAKSGWVVVSGFALGADVVAHRAALECGGATACVMPCGLDRPFPPENRHLWGELLAYSKAVFVSEFPFGMQAATLTLRKRNKTIVALSKGVLIGQTSSKGGAMNAYRFALEQRKHVATFEEDGTDTTSGNRQIALADAGSAFSAGHADEVEWESWLARL
jgi:DNA processing protein